MLGSLVALEAVDAEASGSNRTLFTVKTAENRTVYYSKNQGRKDTFPSPPPVASALAHCPNKYILNLGIKNQACHRWSDCNGYVHAGHKNQSYTIESAPFVTGSVWDGDA